MNNPSSQPPAHPEAPKGLSYRTAILLVLAGIGLMVTKDSRKPDKHNNKADEITAPARTSENDLCKKLGSVIEEDQAKDEITKKLDSNRLQLSERLRGKMKPLKSVIPRDVLMALEQYYSEKAKMLDSVMVVLDDKCEFWEEGRYEGRINIGKSGRFLFDTNGKYHLIRINSDRFESLYPEEPDLRELNKRFKSIFPNADPLALEKMLKEMVEKDKEEKRAFAMVARKKEEFKLALVLVHELFGHAYDHKDGFTDVSVELKDLVDGDKDKLAHAQSFLEDYLNDEFRAFYEENRFLDWNIQTYSDLWKGYVVGCKKIYDATIEGYYTCKDRMTGEVYACEEETPERNFYNHNILHDFPLYEEYTKGRDSQDWTEFKRAIATDYIDLPGLEAFSQFCARKYEYKAKEKFPRTKPNDNRMCGFFDGVSETMRELTTRGEILRLCVKNDFGNFTPFDPNKKIRKSNRKK